jgi:hypothetical protein
VCVSIKINRKILVMELFSCNLQNMNEKISTYVFKIDI